MNERPESEFYAPKPAPAGPKRMLLGIEEVTTGPASQSPNPHAVP
eukprot:gene24381-29248_t